MEGRQPNRLGESLTAHEKRVFVAVAAVVLVILGGFGIWSVTGSGSYGRSGNGCVNVVIPSTTGGGVVHKCGGAARAMCEAATTGHDRLAQLTRTQCRQAGITPTTAGRPTP